MTPRSFRLELERPPRVTRCDQMGAAIELTIECENAGAAGLLFDKIATGIAAGTIAFSVERPARIERER